MEITRYEFYRAIRKERRRAAFLILWAGMLGVILGRCSAPCENRNVKIGAVSPKTFGNTQTGGPIVATIAHQKEIQR
jgi:hypothetical protein